MNPATDYLSTHIYYNLQDLRPLLVKCIDPLVRRLREEALISSYFFIRYWEGGAHVRLRLKPRTPECAAAAQQRVDEAVGAFLRDQPSVFDLELHSMQPLMKALFISEYGAAAYDERYGEGGAIPLEPNNSWRRVPYVPETDRYGGLHGVALSERHFEVSSDIALELLREGNHESRANTLGMAIQMMLFFAWTFLDDTATLAHFFRTYAGNFHGVSVNEGMQHDFDGKWGRQGERIVAQIRRLHDSHAHLPLSAGTAVGQLMRHAAKLRDEARALFDVGRLDFRPPVDDFRTARVRLLSSYLHMLNNRLGVLILEEIYMASMLARSIESMAVAL